MNFIKCLVGEAVMKEIQKDQPSIFFETCSEFEMAKRTIKPDSDMKFNVKIPAGLAETYATHNAGKKLKSILIVVMENKTEIGVAFTGDKIKLASKDPCASSVMMFEGINLQQNIRTFRIIN
jgi:hypothetical protein